MAHLICYRNLCVFKRENLADAYIKRLGKVVEKCACPVCGCRVFIVAA